MLRCATRSKDSSSYGSSAASATRKATRPSGSRPTLPLAARIISSEMSTPRTLACGNSRAKSSAPSPVPVPTSSARSGAGFTWRRAAASGARCSTEPAPVRPSQPAAERSKKRRIGPRIAGHAQGARTISRFSMRPATRIRAGRRSSLRGRHSGARPAVARGALHAGHLAVPLGARRHRPLAWAADAGSATSVRPCPPHGARRPPARGLRRRRRGGGDLREPSRGLPGGAGAAPQAGRPEAAAAKGGGRARAWWRPSTRAAAASRSPSTPGARRRR